MKDQDVPPTLVSIPSPTTNSTPLIRKAETSSSRAARWSAGDLTGLSDDLSIPTYDDLDILEVEDREKVVRHLWDLYTQRQTGSGRRSMTRLPRFWQETFEAAYDPSSSDVPAARDAAVSEIAKMHIGTINVIDPFPLQSKGIRELKRKIKQRKESKELGSSS